MVNKDYFLTPQIAELLGAHAGDGTLYQTNYSTVWEIRGDIKEKKYYTEHICPLLRTIFGIEIKSKFRSGGANGVWGIQTTNKIIIATLLQFGSKPGSKTYTVNFPKEIFNSSLEIKQAFLRGLFDTDGCLRFDKQRPSKLKNYPRLEFTSASRNLIFDLDRLLNELNFQHFGWKDRTCSRICISGKLMLERWFNEIKPANPKHLKKYLIWKRKGYYL